MAFKERLSGLNAWTGMTWEGQKLAESMSFAALQYKDVFKPILWCLQAGEPWASKLTSLKPQFPLPVKWE